MSSNHNFLIVLHAVVAVIRVRNRLQFGNTLNFVPHFMRANLLRVAHLLLTLLHASRGIRLELPISAEVPQMRAELLTRVPVCLTRFLPYN
jgi:hypothetical protein